MWKTKPAKRSETFVALRARHQSMRIVEEVLRGDGIDVESFNCPACGVELDTHETTAGARFRCSECKAIIELPPHLRNRVQTRLPEKQVEEPEPVPTAQSLLSVIALPPLPQPPPRLDPPPFWAKLFCIFWFAVAVAAIAMMILQLK